MNVNVKENMIQVIILDISGIYAQIHNQGYFDKETVEDIKKKYSNTQHWWVVVIDNKTNT